MLDSRFRQEGEAVTWTLVEPYAGLGAYSLWAVSRSRPPVSRQGSKAGFAPAVLKAWGLSRVRWGAAWLNDLSPVCGLIHGLYASAALRDAVAARLWSWVPCPVCRPADVGAALQGARVDRARLTGVAGCEECAGTGTQDARRLWDRLRSLQPSGDLVELTAAAVYLQSRSFSLTPVGLKAGYKPEVDTYPRGGQPQQHEDSPRWAVAERVAELPSAWATHGFRPEQHDGVQLVLREETAQRVAALPVQPTIRLTQQDAALCLPEGLAEHTLVILDPPYEGTSGYHHSSSRAVVLMLARAWSDAGALVIIHEACGLASALGSGWIERPAAPLRRGHSPFWSGGQERELITANRPPVWWPAQQQGLFG